jgi:mRNA interferase MazF
MIFDFGDIVLVPFPFTDQSTTKKRPAAVVCSQRYARSTRTLIILAISSRGGRELDRPVENWHEAGLLKASFFKPVITTVQLSLVSRRLGSLSATDQTSLREMVLDFLPNDR